MVQTQNHLQSIQNRTKPNEWGFSLSVCNIGDQMRGLEMHAIIYQPLHSSGFGTRWISASPCSFENIRSWMFESKMLRATHADHQSVAVVTLTPLGMSCIHTDAHTITNTHKQNFTFTLQGGVLRSSISGLARYVALKAWVSCPIWRSLSFSVAISPW